LAIIYEDSSNIKLYFYETLLITFFFQKLIPIFLRILPAPVYTVAIYRTDSLCPFQKCLWLLVQ